MQGTDGTPFLSFYDKTHALSFVWDGTAGDWIDVSFGGYSEPVIARIPWTPSIRAEWGEPSLKGFSSACEAFINLIHQMEEVTVGGHE